MNLKQLEAFVRIANNGSFSRTAKELFLTQPTVSSYINNLEEELGVRLFVRSTKDVSLSEDGKKIYLYAKDIVALSEKIRGTFSDVPNDAANEIVISASSIPGQYMLPGILAAFGRKYPHATFRVTETDSLGVIEDIIHHRADLGFSGMAVPGNGCEFEPFCQDELVLITPNAASYRTHLNDGRVAWALEDAFVMREGGSGTRKEALKVLEESGIDTEALRVVACFRNTETILRAVEQGIGVAVVSMLAVEEAVARGNVLAFHLTPGGAYRNLYLVTNREYPLAEAARKLRKMVLAGEAEASDETNEALNQEIV